MGTISAAWAAFKLSKAFRPALGVLAILVLGVAVFLLGRCTHHDNSGEIAQAQQTNSSGQAAAAAASNAIGTLENRTVTDAAIDTAVAKATKGIDDAQTVDAIHDTVVNSVCREASHSHDPACRVQ